MRVVLETRALANRGGGVRLYVEQLRKQLLLRTDLKLEELPALANKMWLSWWLQWQVPRVLGKSQPAVAHFTKADVPRQKTVPTVVTIYDVIPLLFPAGQKWLPRWYWPGALARAARYSDAIITISEASKRDIVERLQVAPEKVTVTKPGAEHWAGTGTPDPKMKVSDSFILFVGTLEARKNVPVLIRAFARVAGDIPHRLVIVGRSANDYRTVVAAMRDSGLAERIELKDFVPSEELAALYRQADLFVWPSVYEGWGLPPLEALAAGVPTIVSDGGSLPEVVGEAGVVVPFTTRDVAARVRDAAFELALAQTMRAVLNDPAQLAARRAAGPRQARRFSWADLADQTVAVYKEVTQ